jgi:hypothetical protein
MRCGAPKHTPQAQCSLPRHCEATHTHHADAGLEVGGRGGGRAEGLGLGFRT